MSAAEADQPAPAGARLRYRPAALTVFATICMWAMGDLFIWVISPLYFDVSSSIAEIHENYLGKIVFVSICYAGILLFGRSFFMKLWRSLDNTKYISTSRYLVWACIIFLVIYSAIFVYLGGLSWRRSLGNVVTGSQPLYYVRALEGVPLLSCMVLALKTNRFRIASTAAIGLYIFVQILANNRGVAYAALVAIALIQWDWVKTHLRTVTILAATGVVAFSVIGVQREWLAVGGTGFAPEEYLTGKAIKSTMFRLSEYYGHFVFNRSAQQDFQRDPFRNFDRIALTFVPAAAVDTKKPLDDGPEVLKYKFGFSDVGQFLSLPITFIADTYLRFGIFGILIGPIYISLFLLFWGEIARRAGPSMGSIVLIYIFVHLIRLYPNSFLGVINFFLYKPARDLILFSVLVLGVSSMAALRRR